MEKRGKLIEVDKDSSMQFGRAMTKFEIVTIAAYSL